MSETTKENEMENIEGLEDSDDSENSENQDDLEDLEDLEDSEDFDDDNYERNQRKSSRKRQSHGGLILQEVEDASDEDEEDTLAGEEGFKEMERMIKERERSEIYNKRRLNRIDYAIRDASQDQLEEIAKRYTEMGKSYQDESIDIEIPKTQQPTSMYKKRLLPTVNDPSLWMVRCQMGQEANAVLALMRKYLFLKNKGDPISILSAVYQNGIKGYIYVEAHKQSHVKKAIENLSYFTYGSNKQKMVPLNEMPDVLKVVKETILVEPDSWVRIRRGEYRNDLAQVDSVDKVKNSVILKLIPRINYCQNKEGEKKFFRAEAALFNVDKIRREGGVMTQDGTGFYIYNGNKYKNGLLYKRFPVKSLIVTGVEPKLSELEKFKLVSDLKNNDVSVTLNKSLNNLQSVSNSNSVFKVGDMVQVKNGELAKLIGHIVSISGDAINVKPQHKDLKDIIEFSPDNLLKYFVTGDNIAVISGENEGQNGIVVRVEDPYVIVFLNDSFSQVMVFSNNLRKTTNRFSGVDSIGKFQVGDFIRIDSNTIGYITKIQKESVEFLNQMGKINTTKINTIQKYTPRRAYFKDKLNNSITIGSNVKVTNNEQYLNVSGQVKMLVFDSAFIYSPMIKQDRCMFTCKIKNLIVESDNSSNHVMESLNTSNIVPMSPRLNNATNEEDARQHFNLTLRQNYDEKKDLKRIRGKTVRIINGPYKGYYGIVRDCTSLFARVELHTNSKTISVGISQIACEGDKRNSFVGRTPSITATPNSFMQTGSHILPENTPHYNLHQGSETPAHQSSMGNRGLYISDTPMYAGAVTPQVFGAVTPGPFDKPDNQTYGDHLNNLKKLK